MPVFISKPTNINPEMNDLLDDGNDEIAEFIATLELDRIVWIPVNPSDTEVRYEYHDGCQA